MKRVGRTGLGTLLAVLPALAVTVQNSAHTGAQTGAQHIRIVLVGDSTVAAEGGWGPGFCALTTPNVTCADLGLNGRSSKSFRAEGAWDRALAQRGQFYFIQFGHNDQKPGAGRHADADTDYIDTLKLYIADARSIGATPVLVSPLSRRNYKDGVPEEDGLRQYAAAAARLAAAEKIPFVDLFALSTAYLRTRTQAEADAFNATTHADAAAEKATAVTPDRTHLNTPGKMFFGRMVAQDVKKTIPALRRDIQLRRK